VPVSGLQPERLYVYLDEIAKRSEKPGDIVEIGCWLGGTSAIASRFAARIGKPRRYVAVDTFAGFVPAHYDHDVRHGLPQRDRHIFDEARPELVRRLLHHWGAGDVELVEGDIVPLRADVLPEQLIVALIDVDLEIPVYHALQKLWPRLARDGIILIDDCPADTSWVGARIGYTRFAEEHNLPQSYRYGMAIAEPNRRSSTPRPTGSTV
jgi:SAM-dependent methyltransferase